MAAHGAFAIQVGDVLGKVIGFCHSAKALALVTNYAHIFPP